MNNPSVWFSIDDVSEFIWSAKPVWTDGVWYYKGGDASNGKGIEFEYGNHVLMNGPIPPRSCVECTAKVGWHESALKIILTPIGPIETAPVKEEVKEPAKREQLSDEDVRAMADALRLSSSEYLADALDELLERRAGQ